MSISSFLANFRKNRQQVGVVNDPQLDSLRAQRQRLDNEQEKIMLKKELSQRNRDRTNEHTWGIKKDSIGNDIDRGYMNYNGRYIIPEKPRQIQSNVPIQRRDFSKQVAHSEVIGLRQKRAQGKEGRRILIETRKNIEKLAQEEQKQRLKVKALRIKGRQSFEKNQMKVQSKIAKGIRSLKFSSSKTQKVVHRERAPVQGESMFHTNNNILDAPNIFKGGTISILQSNGSILNEPNKIIRVKR